jgi:hypothetical protein
LRIGIGMARMSTLCHKIPSFTSYIIYGNALVSHLLAIAQSSNHPIAQ